MSPYNLLVKLGYLWAEPESSESCLISIPSAEFKHARAARIERLTAAGLAIEIVGDTSARVSIKN